MQVELQCGKFVCILQGGQKRRSKTNQKSVYVSMLGAGVLLFISTTDILHVPAYYLRGSEAESSKPQLKYKKICTRSKMH